MTVTITDSEMTFGPYNKSDVFWIEKSDLLKKLGDDIKTVEFILRQKNEGLIFVEAKSSSPQPGNHEDFDKFIEEISEKFTHSLEVFFSAFLKRCDDASNEISQSFSATNCSKCKVILVLVINGHKQKWLPPLRNAVDKKLLNQRKIWRVEQQVIVLNDDMARQKHWIQ